MSSPESSSASSNPSIQFPFSSHASSKVCLHAALNIVSLLDNLPYPNPTNEIPYMTPPFMSPTSRVEIPRTMPTFACCAIQAGYALLMLCFKARVFNKNNLSGSGSVVEGNTLPPTLNGFLNELQQNLRLVVRSLSNYSVAFEAVQGMRGIILLHFSIFYYKTDCHLQMRSHRLWTVDSMLKKCCLNLMDGK